MYYAIYHLLQINTGLNLHYLTQCGFQKDHVLVQNFEILEEVIPFDPPLKVVAMVGSA